MKNALIVINPCAGVKRANKYMTDIITMLCSNGYRCTVQTTAPNFNGHAAVMRFGKGSDLVVCIGGDGTYNEVVSGVIDCGLDCNIGYIPAGSTNDFGASLGLSKNILKAAECVVSGRPQPFDVGSFNGRKFTYVASCGAFTSTSYSTPTDMKNALGHLAYLLEGMKSIPEIKPEHLKFKVNDREIEGDFLFAAICNSTSLGGVLKLDKKYVDMNDGLFEILTVRSPKNISELAAAIHDLNFKNYESSNMIDLFSAEKVWIEASKSTDWSLDGERQEGVENIVIENLHSAIKLIVPNKN